MLWFAYRFVENGPDRIEPSGWRIVHDAQLGFYADRARKYLLEDQNEMNFMMFQYYSLLSELKYNLVLNFPMPRFKAYRYWPWSNVFLPRMKRNETMVEARTGLKVEETKQTIEIAAWILIKDCTLSKGITFQSVQFFALSFHQLSKTSGNNSRKTDIVKRRPFLAVWINVHMHRWVEIGFNDSISPRFIGWLGFIWNNQIDSTDRCL